MFSRHPSTGACTTGSPRISGWLVGIIAPLIVAASLLGGAAAAHADPSVVKLDQVNTDNSVGDIGASATQETAQTFTAGLTGGLTAIELDPDRAGPEATIQVQGVDGTGAPNGIVMGSGTLPATTGSGWVTATLNSPVAVIAGTQYAFAIIVPAGTGDPNDDNYIEPYLGPRVNADGYAGGSLYDLSHGNHLPQYDFLFRTYVRVPVFAHVAPGAPTAGTAIAGAGSATISWTAPSASGDAPITSYTVTSTPAGGTCSTSGTSCSVTGLTPGQPYTFTVVATSTSGTGPASAASNSVTPYALVSLFAGPTGAPLEGSTVSAGSHLTISGSNLQPGALVSVRILPTATTLATAIVAEDGSFRIDTTIPLDAVLGAHTLTATLSGSGIQASTSSAAFTVVAAPAGTGVASPVAAALAATGVSAPALEPVGAALAVLLGSLLLAVPILRGRRSAR